MSNVEHYFENLLFHGHDIEGEPNKNALSTEVQDAIEQCVNYVKYTLHTPLQKCKDCRYFETDVLVPCVDIPLIIGHEVCTKWGGGCRTKEDGYCFLFEAKED